MTMHGEHVCDTCGETFVGTPGYIDEDRLWACPSCMQRHAPDLIVSATDIEHDEGCTGWCSACPVVECAHGSDPSTCPACKGPAKRPERVTVEVVFPAKFDGTCGECNLPISAGQRIAKLSNRKYVHEIRCSEDYR